MDKLSRNVQHHIATFAPEVGERVRRGNRFLGRERDIRDEQNKCVCGICVRTRNIPREKCTLFRDGDVTLVQRQQTELCRPVCMSRSPLRMLGRFIGHLLTRLAKQAASALATTQPRFPKKTMKPSHQHTVRWRQIRAQDACAAGTAGNME